MGCIFCIVFFINNNFGVIMEKNSAVTAVNKVMFHLLDASNMQVLKAYTSINQAIEDLAYRAPEAFYIGVVGEQRALTIDGFMHRFENHSLRGSE